MTYVNNKDEVTLEKVALFLTISLRVEKTRYPLFYGIVNDEKKMHLFASQLIQLSDMKIIIL